MLLYILGGATGSRAKEAEGEELDKNVESGGESEGRKSTELAKECADMKAQLERLEREQKSQFEAFTQLLNRVLVKKNED